MLSKKQMAANSLKSRLKRFREPSGGCLEVKVLAGASDTDIAKIEDALSTLSTFFRCRTEKVGVVAVGHALHMQHVGRIVQENIDSNGDLKRLDQSNRLNRHPESRGRNDS